MEVEKLRVYRIIPIEKEARLGGSSLPHEWKEREEYKQKFEDALEKHRPEKYPPRDKCLFVCFSKDNAYEWANIKYGHCITAYKLLTLEVTGHIYWFMAECYDMLGKECSQEELCKACSSYWASMKENIDDLVVGKEYEGLFVGENKIVAIEYKNYVNGKTKDVE